MDDITVEQVVFDILIPVGIFIAVTVLGYFLRKFLFRRLRHISKRGTKQYVEILIHTINIPSFIWSVMLAIYLALEFSTLSEDIVDIAGKVIFVLSVISIDHL